VAENAPAERHAVAGSALTALVVAFFISVAAQIPHTNVGMATAVAGLAGVLNTFTLGRILVGAHFKGSILVRAGDGGDQRWCLY
jgi:membrane-associated PAP2 superfamily phosphatase